MIKINKKCSQCQRVFLAKPRADRHTQKRFFCSRKCFASIASERATISGFKKLVKPNGNCLEWQGTKSLRTGYGFVSYQNRTIGAHRLSFIIHCGPVPAGLSVCHSCDNRLCVRPDHLFLGTAKDNAQDMISKGRKVVWTGPNPKLQGSNHWASKLDEIQVRKIKLLLNKKMSFRYIGKIFNVAPSTIGFIKAGLTWKHVKPKETKSCSSR